MAFLTVQVSWYQGATLCQTVYTSLYYHNIEYLNRPPSDNQLVTLVLRAYTLAFAKTIDLAYDELSRGNVTDGEDCWLDHYGISVHMTDSVNDAVELLELAEKWLLLQTGKSESTRQSDHRLPILRCWTTFSNKKGSVKGRPRILLILFQNFLVELASSVKQPLLSSDIDFKHLHNLTLRSKLVQCPSSEASGSFCSVSSCLRQCMPLPPKKAMSHEKAWTELRGLIQGFQELERLKSASEWEWKVSPLKRTSI